VLGLTDIGVPLAQKLRSSASTTSSSPRPGGHIPGIVQKLHLLEHLSTKVLVCPKDHRTVFSTVNGVSPLGDRLAFCVIEEPIEGWSFWLKRKADLVISVAALVLLAPVLLIVAIAMKLDSPRPILFRQTRLGFNGCNFELLKFRSMFQEMTDPHASSQTTRNDPRVTRVGFIRRTSIDELP